MKTLQDAFAEMSTENLSAIARTHIRGLLFHVIRNERHAKWSLDEVEKKTRQIDAIAHFPIVKALPPADRDEIIDLAEACLDLIHEELLKDLPAEVAWRKITS